MRRRLFKKRTNPAIVGILSSVIAMLVLTLFFGVLREIAIEPVKPLIVIIGVIVTLIVSFIVGIASLVGIRLQ